jgi:uncharacterized DUF497 family protein
MTRIVIRELIFDERNREHIKKHNVVESEIILAGNNLIYHRQSYKGRYLAIGRSGTRLITIVINRKGPGKYYVVTARDTSKKERRNVYAKEKKQNS